MRAALRQRWIGPTFALALAAAAWSGCAETSGDGAPPPPPRADAVLSEEPILPLPEKVELDPRRVALGKALFFDPLLSRQQDTNCATCHPFERGGADGAVRSQLPGREPVPVNTPTVFNVGQSYRFQVSGRYDSLEAQLDVPMMSPKVMNMTFDEAVARLRASPRYPQLFAEAFPGQGISEGTLRSALAEYQRSLITPNAPFDRFLRGDLAAIDDREKRGYQLFKDLGCISCHQGVNVGGNMLQRFGAFRDYFAGRKVTDADLGLFMFTKREQDRHVFRVPSLRNVALTAPYFHDGSAPTLADAVRVMAEYQLGRTISAEQVELVVAFLGTLTGDASALMEGTP